MHEWKSLRPQHPQTARDDFFKTCLDHKERKRMKREIHTYNMYIPIYTFRSKNTHTDIYIYIHSYVYIYTHISVYALTYIYIYIYQRDYL